MMLNFKNKFFSNKHQAALTLLSTFNDLGSVDPQVALALCDLIPASTNLPTLPGQRFYTSFWALWRSWTHMFTILLLIVLVLKSLAHFGGRPS